MCDKVYSQCPEFEKILSNFLTPGCHQETQEKIYVSGQDGVTGTACLPSHLKQLENKTKQNTQDNVF